MTQERLTMRKIAEVLRLKWECGLSNRTIARSCSISHSTVAQYLRHAHEAGLNWPVLLGKHIRSELSLLYDGDRCLSLR